MSTCLRQQRRGQAETFKDTALMGSACLPGTYRNVSAPITMDQAMMVVSAVVNDPGLLQRYLLLQMHPNKDDLGGRWHRWSKGTPGQQQRRQGSGIPKGQPSPVSQSCNAMSPFQVCCNCHRHRYVNAALACAAKPCQRWLKLTTQFDGRGPEDIALQGGWETDEDVESGAARETVEEAGVRGRLEVGPAAFIG